MTLEGPNRQRADAYEEIAGMIEKELKQCNEFSPEPAPAPYLAMLRKEKARCSELALSWDYEAIKAGEV